jgi:hypothetical protein
MPRLDAGTIRRTAARPMAFQAAADGRPVTLIPVARAHHQHYTVYWQTAPAARLPAATLPPPAAPSAAPAEPGPASRAGVS